MTNSNHLALTNGISWTFSVLQIYKNCTVKKLLEEFVIRGRSNVTSATVFFSGLTTDYGERAVLSMSRLGENPSTITHKNNTPGGFR